MEGKLIELVTAKLLEKFGAGNHKPGSGSASAFQGMLSAQMIRTVIDLTNEPKRRKKYSEHLPELLRIKKEIETRIYPILETLFQEDSIQFDKVINLRDLRDQEKDPFKKRQLDVQCQETLKIATEIPLKIADFCLMLGLLAAYVFDHGFKSARGDSGVALNSAISAVASCLSIIELNLASLPVDDWMVEVLQQKKEIKSRYNKLSPKGAEKLAVLEKEVDEHILFEQSFAYFRRGNLIKSIQSNSEIEKIVKRLHNTLWQQRNKIWKQDVPEHLIQVLKPDVVLKKVMNYVYIEELALGNHKIEGGRFEIAGLIDQGKKVVKISKQFPKESQNFTIAHELGHSILHSQTVLHRDKSIDASTFASKSPEEIQADKFATYFLMPANLVKELFKEIFRLPRFVINTDTALALRAGSVDKLRQECKNTRELARKLSSSKYFAGKKFKSLSEIFGVSVETMAIRLEELNLVQY